ncbi:hypothetical protein NQZ68_004979 [Dissostichus eleginoides]|nr:hypothetical protein NQZ68_004979 [Dissostichus eleginoides]
MEEREDALEHPLLKGFSTGRPTEEGALTRTELLLNCNPWRPPVATPGMTPKKEQPQAQDAGLRHMKLFVKLQAGGVQPGIKAVARGRRAEARPSQHSPVVARSRAHYSRVVGSSICRKALKGSPLNMLADRGKDGGMEEEERSSPPLQTPTVMRALSAQRGWRWHIEGRASRLVDLMEPLTRGVAWINMAWRISVQSSPSASAPITETQQSRQGWNTECQPGCPIEMLNSTLWYPTSTTSQLTGTQHPDPKVSSRDLNSNITNHHWKSIHFP